MFTLHAKRKSHSRKRELKASRRALPLEGRLLRHSTRASAKLRLHAFANANPIAAPHLLLPRRERTGAQAHATSNVCVAPHAIPTHETAEEATIEVHRKRDKLVCARPQLFSCACTTPANNRTIIGMMRVELRARASVLKRVPCVKQHSLANGTFPWLMVSCNIDAMQADNCAIVYKLCCASLACSEFGIEHFREIRNPPAHVPGARRLERFMVITPPHEEGFTPP